MINNERSPELKSPVKPFHLLQRDLPQMATGGEIWVHPSIYHHHISCTHGVQLTERRGHTLDKLPVRGRATPHSHLQTAEFAISLIHADRTWASRRKSTQTRQECADSTHKRPKAWGWNKWFPIIKLVLPQKEKRSDFGSWSKTQLVNTPTKGVLGFTNYIFLTSSSFPTINSTLDAVERSGGTVGIFFYLHVIVVLLLFDCIIVGGSHANSTKSGEM